jgi:hypothetical protein
MIKVLDNLRNVWKAEREIGNETYPHSYRHFNFNYFFRVAVAYTVALVNIVF